MLQMMVLVTIFSASPISFSLLEKDGWNMIIGLAKVVLPYVHERIVFTESSIE